MAKRITLLVLAAVLLAWFVGGAGATGWRKTNDDLVRLNARLHGKVIDHTDNHGKDNRIWSRALGQRRDLYVYLPPNFDPHLRYPLMIALHGYGYDEQSMLGLFPAIDRAICSGELPPLIVAAPDGTVNGEPGFSQPGTFFANTKLGDYEDFVLNDVWDFVVNHYPCRADRDGHILAGVSMGGFAAYSMGIRHRYAFGTVIGILPPLNLRWTDDCCNYLAKFDPCHWGWRTKFDRPSEVLGRFGAGLVPITVKHLVTPLFDTPEEAVVEISRLNPIELIERTCLRNGELNMYVGYGAHDEFNVDSQVESFLYMCKWRQIYVGVGYDPGGHHDAQTVYRLTPGMISWLAPRLAMSKDKAPEPSHMVARPDFTKKGPQPPANTRPRTPTRPASVTATTTPPRAEPMLENVPAESASTKEKAAGSSLQPPPPAGPYVPQRVIPNPRREDLGPSAGPSVTPGPAYSSPPPDAQTPKQ